MKNLHLPSSAASADAFERIPLLRAALEILVDELAILSARQAKDLPELKKKKVVIASRLGTAETAPSLPVSEAYDLAMLRSLIRALEAQSRPEIGRHLDLLGKQILAIQEEHQFWRECLNVSFGKYCEPV